MHDDFAVYTIAGLISNEYGMTEIEISSGDNYFDLKEGTYQIEFVMDGSHVPWEKTVFINSDKEFNVVYESISPTLVNNESILDNSVGPWCIENENMLKTQSNTYYSNGDAPQSVQWIESDLIDVSGTNRLVLSVSHRYETEWDYDPISVSFLDINDSLLASKSWTGDNWDYIQQDFLTAETDSVFNYVKLLLEFSKDETVNYRGWEIESLELFPVYDNYLGIEENNSKNMPKIPLKIHSLFPNPSYGKFQLGLSNFTGGEAVVTVFNLLGQNILSKSFSDLRPGSHQIRLDLNDLNGLPLGSGVYFIQFESLKEQAIKKCIILKN